MHSEGLFEENFWSQRDFQCQWWLMVVGCRVIHPRCIPMQPFVKINNLTQFTVKYLRWRFEARFTRCANLLPTSNIERRGLLLAMWPANDHPTLQSSWSWVYFRSLFWGTPVVFGDHAVKESERLTASARGVYLGGLVYSSIPPAA